MLYCSTFSRLFRIILLGGLLAQAQVGPGAVATPSPLPGTAGAPSPLQSGSSAPSPFSAPALSPGVLKLIELDARFSQATVEGGGAAFGKWFAPDAVALNNGQPEVRGGDRIAANAKWLARDYQLSWHAEGAIMGPGGDMGTTWGHYDAVSKDAAGTRTTKAGRYITVWRREPSGDWKVVLDASADEPPAAGECCVLPKP